MSLTGILPVELVQLVIEYYNRDDSDTVILRAVSRTFRDLLLKNDDEHYRPKMMSFVSSIPMISWAVLSAGYPLKSWLCMHAAAIGDLEMLKWLRDERCPWDAGVTVAAAQGGHLEVLKWARQNGCQINFSTSMYVAEIGHLEILKFLKSDNCMMQPEWWLCAYAARGGQLEVLKWLRSEGYPWDGLIYYNARVHGHLELLKWVKENGCPGY